MKNKYINITLILMFFLLLIASCFNEVTTEKFLDGGFIPSPDIKHIFAISKNIVRVTFDQEMSLDGLDSLENYFISDECGTELKIIAITVLSDSANRILEVQTLDMTLMTKYLFTAMNVKNSSGRTVVTQGIIKQFLGVDSILPPSNVHYSEEDVVYYISNTPMPIQPNVPLYTGFVDSFLIQPELPNGLVFDSQTGIISGVALVESPETIYTIIATNLGGSAIAHVKMKIIAEPPVLQISLSKIDFGHVYWINGVSLPSGSFTIKNSGTKTMNWYAYASDPWIVISPGMKLNVTNSDAPECVTVTIDTTKLNPGSHTGIINVFSDTHDTLDNNQAIAVTIDYNTWSRESLITENSLITYTPVPAMDDLANMIIIGHRIEEGKTKVYAFYCNTTSCDEPVRIDALEANHSYGQVKFDNNGNAIAYIYQTNNTGSEGWLYANRYRAGLGWQGAQLVKTLTEAPGNVQLVFNSNNDPILVWDQYDDDSDIYAMYTSRYESGTGWGLEQNVVSFSEPISFYPGFSIASGKNDTMIIVWKTGQKVFANRYVENVGWSAEVRLDLTEGTTENYNPKIALDDNGNAIAIWSQSDGSHYYVYTNRFDALSGSWTGPVKVSSVNRDSSHPNIAFTPHGTAIAVWKEQVDPYCKIFTNTYLPGSGWGSSRDMHPEIDNIDAYGQLLLAANNNTSFIFWQQVDFYGRKLLFSSSYANGTWGKTGILSPNSYYDVEECALAVNNNRKSAIVWREANKLFFKLYEE